MLEETETVRTGKNSADEVQKIRRSLDIGKKATPENRKPQAKAFRNSKENPKRPKIPRNIKRDRQGNCKGNPQENFELKEITDFEREVFKELAETFTAGLSNSVRIEMLAYCLKERSFTDIMQTLRLNPASLKHHQDLLQANGLIKKTGKGRDTRYKTTPLGKTLLNLTQSVLKVVRTP